METYIQKDIYSEKISTNYMKGHIYYETYGKEIYT